ncbi:protein phosphatase PP2A regulatory subunit A [Penicillium expansum]|nr:protein phosphatase PP2A regulatory subunit A [Penicillium expansum]
MGWLGDTVFSIREAATENLKKLTEVFGVEWSKASIIPKVMAMGQHPNYLYRMTTCFAVSTLTPVSYAVLIATLRRLPADKTLVEVEKSEEAIAPSPKSLELIQSRVVPSLEKLQEDDDVDVRYFATTAGGNQDEMQTSP